jgi:hypothetical protein
VCALINPEIVATQGGATVDAPAVLTWPVSGVGEIPTRPLDESPYARPVMNRNRSVAEALAGR